MRILLLIPLSILLFGAAAAETYYKWVDKNGVTHYSDRPRPGAEQIVLPTAQTYESKPVPTTGSATGTQDKAVAGQYNKLDLWRPKTDEVFVNTAQTVDVRLRLDPALQPGHSVWIYLDGKRVDGLPTSGEEFQLKDVFRGTHSVSAVVVGAKGEPLIRSAPVTFHLRQTSVLTRPRQPPAAPRP